MVSIHDLVSLQNLMTWLLLITGLSLVIVPLNAQTTRFLVGTTNGDVEESVAICQLDEEKETLIIEKKFKAGKRPGYIALHGEFLYAVSTDFRTEEENTLRAFKLKNGGTDLELLNEVSSKGLNPCHLAVDATGASLFSANYTSGSIAQYQIKTDGSLGDNWYFQQFRGSSMDPNRQQQPHAHYVNTTIDNKFALTADLGTDKVMVHRVDSQGKLQEYTEQPFFELPPGSGPRHLEFHPNSKWIYVLNELNSTITAVRYENDFFEVGKTISTLPEDFTEVSYTAAVRMHPSGRSVYCSNRGSDSISWFTIDDNGDLTLKQTFGQGLGWVRDFNVTPSGKFIIAGNEKENQVALLKLSNDGQIDKLISSLELPSPSCFVFLDQP